MKKLMLLDDEEVMLVKKKEMEDLQFNLLQLVRTARQDPNVHPHTYLWILNYVKAIWSEQLELSIVDFYQRL